MKKAKFKQLKGDSKIFKGDKIKKELREKGKSKFLGYREDLQEDFKIDINKDYLREQRENIELNRKRRANLKINQEKYPESYYKDCYVYSEEYKNRHNK